MPAYNLSEVNINYMKKATFEARTPTAKEINFVEFDNEWKMAFDGIAATLNVAICTLPATWQECFIRYNDTVVQNADFRVSSLVIPLDKGVVIYEGSGGVYELGWKVTATNEIHLTTRGQAGDGEIYRVYYR